jgi:hypothetical protein
MREREPAQEAAALSQQNKSGIQARETEALHDVPRRPLHRQDRRIIGSLAGITMSQ